LASFTSEMLGFVQRKFGSKPVAARVGGVVEELRAAQEHHQVGDEVAAAVPARVHHQPVPVRVLAHHLLERRAVRAVVHAGDVHVAEFAVAEPLHLLLVRGAPSACTAGGSPRRGDGLHHQFTRVAPVRAA
jgi:hypothetical protein